MVKHGFLILPAYPTEITKKTATVGHHLGKSDLLQKEHQLAVKGTYLYNSGFRGWGTNHIVHPHVLVSAEMQTLKAFAFPNLDPGLEPHFKPGTNFETNGLFWN